MEKQEIGNLVFVGSREGQIAFEDGRTETFPLQATMPVVLQPVTEEEAQQTLYHEVLTYPVFSTRNYQGKAVLDSSKIVDKKALVFNNSAELIDTPYFQHSEMLIGRKFVFDMEEQAVNDYLASKGMTKAHWVNLNDEVKEVELPYQISRDWVQTIGSYGYNAGPKLLNDEQIGAAHEKWPNAPQKKNEGGISREDTFIIKGYDPKTEKYRLFIADTGSIAGVWVNDDKIGTELSDLVGYEEIKDERKSPYNRFTIEDPTDAEFVPEFYKDVNDYKSAISRTVNAGIKPLKDGDIITIGKDLWGDLFQFRYEAR